MRLYLGHRVLQVMKKPNPDPDSGPNSPLSNEPMPEPMPKTPIVKIGAIKPVFYRQTMENESETLYLPKQDSTFGWINK